MRQLHRADRPEGADRPGDDSDHPGARPTLQREDDATACAGAGPNGFDAGSALALFDRLPFGVALVAPDAILLATNAEARRRIDATGCGLRVQRGRLLPSDPRLVGPWRTALDAVARGAACLAGVDDAPGVALSPWSDPWRGPRVLCTFVPTRDRQDDALRAYAARHGLTASEAAVLADLAAGASPKQIALRRGSSEGTVRSQLKTVLLKTGTHGLREVVVELLRIPPLLREG